MKRTHAAVAEAEADDDQESAEMNVDDEEKVEPEEESDDEEEEPPSRPGATPFLDTFYGLSSADARERAAAAKDMIQYCLLGPEANISDASYALRRLLNGLCSGRAAARQGNASALAMFVKLAVQQGKLQSIQRETLKEGESELSDLAFIRHRLLVSTEPGDTQGRRKGSEQRDYKFGRLFGILGIVRSGVLLPTGDERPKLDEILEVTTHLVNDLSELYAYKKWMREPAAHAIGTLLNSYYAICPYEEDAVTVVDRLVHETIVPKLLARGDLAGDTDDSTAAPLFSSFSAEQIALVMNIQTHASMHTKELPAELQQSILTKETIPVLADALSETSAVTQPRTHLVWDAFASFISDPVKKGSSKKIEVRQMRDTCPVGSERVGDILELVMRHVVMERLLGIVPEQQEVSATKSTHERSALALCLVRNLSGVEFMSSISGWTRVLVDEEVIETVVFCPAIVKNLILNTLSAGTGGGKKKQGSHLLRPLTVQVMESIVAALDADSSLSTSEQSHRRRIAFARPLIECDPRFDAKTKSRFVAQLIQLDNGSAAEYSKLWDEYVRLLETRVASASVVTEGSSVSVRETSTYAAQGYLDLLFNFLKTIRRGSSSSDSFYVAQKTREVLCFLLSVAFFDNQAVEEPSATPASKKKKKKTQKAKVHPAVSSAMLVKVTRDGRSSKLPYTVRSVASSRFFSLIADCMGATLHSTDDEREFAAMDFLADLVRAWDELEESGAVSVAPKDDDSMDDDEEEPPRLLVESMVELADKFRTGKGTRAQRRCSVGLATLASTLYLHMLSCGGSDEGLEDEDLDEDDEVDAEQVSEFIGALKECAESYFGNTADENPLTGLADLCSGILASPLAAGSQTRGAYPKLLREVVRLTWVGGLSLAAESKGDGAIDSRLLPILLGSLGADDHDAMDVDEGDGVDEDESSEDDTADEASEGAIFPEAAQHPGIEDVAPDDGAGSDGEGDFELNPDRLHAFLEDSDNDEVELEHHAGADAALAKFIKAKQESRKAGKMALERAQIAQQLRCSLLLETLVAGRDDGWGVLLSTDVMLDTVLPLLRLRKALERGVLSPEKSTEQGLGEKRALLDRVTTILKAKVLKFKHGEDRWPPDMDATGYCSELASKLMNDMKGRITKEHRSCCSSSLAVVVRSVPDLSEKLKVARVYGEAVNEWATKRTSRLDASVFEDLIKHCPALAQASLSSPIAKCASKARSPFLKAEALRLLSLLFNPKLNTRANDLEKTAYEAMVEIADLSLEAFALVLSDSEMRKAKRAREIIKSLEKVLNFVALSTGCKLSSIRSEQLKKILNGLKDQSDSQAVESGVDKVLSAISDLSNSAAGEVRPQRPVDEDPEDDDDDARDQPTAGSKNKKKKKKGKKKKGR